MNYDENFMAIAQTPALHGVMLMYNFKEHRRITFDPSGFDLLLYPYTCFSLY